MLQVERWGSFVSWSCWVCCGYCDSHASSATSVSGKKWVRSTLISFHLIWPHFICSYGELGRSLWSDPVRHGCDKSQRWDEMSDMNALLEPFGMLSSARYLHYNYTILMSVTEILLQQLLISTAIVKNKDVYTGWSKKTGLFLFLRVDDCATLMVERRVICQMTMIMTLHVSQKHHTFGLL